MRKWIAVMSSAVILVACTSIRESTYLPTSLKASEFNNIASRYIERPTTTQLRTLSDGSTVLNVTMDEYGFGAGASIGQNVPLNFSVNFDSRYIDQYLPMLDKYLEWSALATQRSDIISKTIGEAPTWSQIGTGKLKFAFHSGNASQHYLEIGFCLTACVEERMMLSHTNVVTLRQLLEDMKAGKINQLNVDDVYR